MANNESHLTISCTGFDIRDHAVFSSAVPFLEEDNLDAQFSAQKASNPESNTLALVLNLELESSLKDEAIQKLREQGTEFRFNVTNDGIVRVGFMTVQVSFEVEEFEELLDDEENLSVPQPVVVEMLEVGYNGLRGAWATQSKGTDLDDFILPIVDIWQLASHLFEEWSGGASETDVVRG